MSPYLEAAVRQQQLVPKERTQKWWCVCGARGLVDDEPPGSPYPGFAHWVAEHADTAPQPEVVS